MKPGLFLMTVNKKGKLVIVPYPKKKAKAKVWDNMIHKKTKKTKSVKRSIW